MFNNEKGKRSQTKAQNTYGILTCLNDNLNRLEANDRYCELCYTIAAGVQAIHMHVTSLKGSYATRPGKVWKVLKFKG